ncbi:hypothetical protein ACFQ2Y_20150 [Streptomyces malaysiensis subsp. malaysiensis]
MRLPTALSLRAVLPAAALAFAPALYGVPAYAAGAQPATCGDRNATDFPIEAHLRDGPDQYARGGGWRGWHLELRNATDTGCRAIHPIAVLVDQAHELRPRHIGFEFLDPYAEGGATGGPSPSRRRTRTRTSGSSTTTSRVSPCPRTRPSTSRCGRGSPRTRPRGR